MTKRKNPLDFKPDGRPPLYRNPEDLAAKIQYYFNSISTKRAKVISVAASGLFSASELNAMTDEEKQKVIPLADNNGNPIIEDIWIKPPTILELQLHLGMSKDTWSDYGLNPKFADIIKHARHICESYLFAETAKRESSTNGLKFLMSAVYGYKETSAVQVENVGRLEDEIR